MTAPTRREWQDRILAAYTENTCPQCGLTHRADWVDYWGAVWFTCPITDQSHYVGTEPVPPYFAPDPDDAADLPF